MKKLTKNIVFLIAFSVAQLNSFVEFEFVQDPKEKWVYIVDNVRASNDELAKKACNDGGGVLGKKIVPPRDSRGVNYKCDNATKYSFKNDVSSLPNDVAKLSLPYSISSSDNKLIKNGRIQKEEVEKDIQQKCSESCASINNTKSFSLNGKTFNNWDIEARAYNQLDEDQYFSPYVLCYCK